MWMSRRDAEILLFPPVCPYRLNQRGNLWKYCCRTEKHPKTNTAWAQLYQMCPICGMTAGSVIAACGHAHIQHISYMYAFNMGMNGDGFILQHLCGCRHGAEVKDATLTRLEWPTALSDGVAPPTSSTACCSYLFWSLWVKCLWG